MTREEEGKDRRVREEREGEQDEVKAVNNL